MKKHQKRFINDYQQTQVNQILTNSDFIKNADVKINQSRKIKTRHFLSGFGVLASACFLIVAIVLFSQINSNDSDNTFTGSDQGVMEAGSDLFIATPIHGTTVSLLSNETDNLISLISINVYYGLSNRINYENFIMVSIIAPNNLIEYVRVFEPNTLQGSESNFQNDRCPTLFTLHTNNMNLQVIVSIWTNTYQNPYNTKIELNLLPFNTYLRR